MWDWILYGLVAAFIAYETIARFAFRNIGVHTLSNRIAYLEARYGWPIRAAVAVAVIALGFHLEGAF